ncbi:hypothetical protein MMC30_007801 [Trapelia coarctata]|nr:hypothetical protein [Trapelia coarctata]
MDALSALSLASAVVQFVDFGSKLFVRGAQLYRSPEGALLDNVELGSIAEDLRCISTGLRASRSPEHLVDDELALWDLSSSCQKLAERILSTLEDLVARNPRTRWNSVRQAFRSMLKEKEIRALEKSLDSYRSQLTVRLLAVLRNQQSTIVTALQSLSKQHLYMDIKSYNNLEILKQGLTESIKEYLSEAKVEQSCMTSKISDIPDQISKLVNRGGELAAEQSILNSLRFREMKSRYVLIADSYTNTFDWIFESLYGMVDKTASQEDHTAFRVWLERGDGIYWISGKAGCGKSTLMKYLCTHRLTKQALRAWADRDNLVIASHFFWAAGNAMQKSQEGLLQSLLYEILRQCPEMIPKACSARWEEFRRSSSHDSNPWTIKELSLAFAEIGKHCMISTKFCFFIDGLDEYRGDSPEIIDALKAIVQSAKIKVCLSSRPWNAFQTVYGKSHNQLVLHKYTRNDIKLFVQEQLDEDEEFQSLKAFDQQYGDFTQEIVDKAQGVFLWVFLVVRSLRRGFGNADTITDLRKRLMDLPSDLEEFFRRMLDSVEPIYHQQMAQMLQVVTVAAEPLSLFTLAFLDEQYSAFAIEAPIPFWENVNMVILAQKMKLRVNARCTDLLEVVEISDAEDDWSKYQVNFLHRTVKDFLGLPEIENRLASWISNPFDANSYLCMAFLLQMKSLPSSPYGDECKTIFALINTILYYAGEVESRNGNTEADVLDELDRVLFTLWRSRHHLESYQRLLFRLRFQGRSYQQGWILILAVQWGLHLFVAQMLDNDPHLLNRVFERPLLHYVMCMPARKKHHTHRNIDMEMIMTLLDRGVSPNEEYLGRSAWHQFLCDLISRPEPVEARVIEILLLHGADPTCPGLGVIGNMCSTEDAIRLRKIIADRSSQMGRSPQAGFLGRMKSYLLRA